MRRRWLPLLVVVLLLTGCWSRVEVNDLAIVSLIAIDRTDDGEIQLWLHVIVPARVGGAPAASGTAATPGIPFITLSARGRTVLEAAQKIQTGLPRRLFLAHARVIIMGERLARDGSRLVVDFLTRYRELRLTNYILVLQGDVDTLMAAQVDLEKLPAEYIREIERTQIAPVSTLRDWVQALASKGMDPVLGVVRLIEPPQGAPLAQKPSPRVRTAALFRGDKLVEFAPEPVSRGIMWLRGQVRRAVVTVSLPGVPGNISVEWLSSTVQRSVRMEKGKLVFQIAVRTEGDISEDQALLDLSEPAQLRRVEAQLNREIKRRMDLALDTIKELQIDPAGFGEQVHQHLPAVWKQVEPRWRQTLPKCQFVVTVDARIRRTGLSSKPRGAPESDLIKGGR